MSSSDGRCNERMGRMAKFQLGSWSVNHSTTIIKDRWIDLRADDCTTASGVSITPFYVLRYPDWAHIVCTDRHAGICVVSQYRHAVGRTMMELPGGVVEAGEDPLKAAQRELLEETGIRGRDWRNCGSYSTNPATHTNSIHVFACEVDTMEAPRLDPSEDIRHQFLALDEIKAAIHAGEFAHLLHVGALARALDLI